jgi:hypothetical protein
MVQALQTLATAFDQLSPDEQQQALRMLIERRKNPLATFDDIEGDITEEDILHNVNEAFAGYEDEGPQYDPSKTR